MKKLSIIIPCFNEEESLAQLFSKLNELDQSLFLKYDYFYIFIDDGSVDDTYQLLKEFEKQNRKVKIIRHNSNLNLGAALRSGLFESRNSDYVAFLDSDCTYEPKIVLELLNHLDNGADLVTVSPYHPLGKVVGLPFWRLLLSKGLSLIYRSLTLTSFYTFTAMVRAVKTEKMYEILSDANDFSFVAESFLKALNKKFNVVEVPTELGVRKYGYSKMRLTKTIKSHLQIIKKLIRGKL